MPKTFKFYIITFTIVSLISLGGLAFFSANKAVKPVYADVGTPVTIQGKLEIMHYDKFHSDEDYRNEYYIVTLSGNKYSLKPTNESSLQPNSTISITGTLKENSIEGFVNTVSIENEADNSETPEVAGPTSPTPYDIAVFLVTPQSGGNPTPFTQLQASTMVNEGQFAKYVKEGSFGKRIIDADIYGWIPVADCTNAGLNSPEFLDYLTQNAVPLQSYKHVAFVRNCGINAGKAIIGQGTWIINGNQYNFSIAWINAGSDILAPSSQAAQYPQPFSWTNFDQIFTHELLHGFGLDHSNGLICDNGGSSLSSNCFPVDYGNTFDVMGRGTGHSLHLNASQKQMLGWLKAKSITASGSYTIGKVEYKTLNSQLFRVRNPMLPTSSIVYSIESRKGKGFDQALLTYPVLAPNQNGIFIMRDNGAGQTQLIDTKTVPTGTNWFDAIKDGALTGSNTFSDPDRGITIGPITNVTSDSVTFNVTIDPVPACQHVVPEVVTYSPYNYNPNVAPSSISLLLTVRNQDTVLCGPSNFKIDLVPQNLPASTPTITRTLNAKDFYPAANTSFYGPFIPAGTPPGTYLYNIVATNIDFPIMQTVAPILVVVP